MSTAAEFLSHETRSHEARPDEENVKVLFVEDSMDFARLVCLSLDHAKRGHFDVMHTTEMHEAVFQLESRNYDVVLLDLGLPDSDRKHTIDTAAGFAHRLPVVVLTGTESDEVASEVQDAGALAYLVKERLDRAELPQALLSAIQRHRRLGGGAADPMFCRIPH